jgi:glycine cleavage system protein P-like pyridoxal-binding family
MADYGIDPWWMSHEPWIVPEPFTPEAGEMYSKEDLDYWMAVVAKISEEAYANPELVKSAPHKQAIAQIKGDALNDRRNGLSLGAPICASMARAARRAARPTPRNDIGVAACARSDWD